MRPSTGNSSWVAWTIGALGREGEVVAVEADVDEAERDLRLEQLAGQRLQPLGEDRAATMDADDRDADLALRPRSRRVLLDDLVRDPHQRAAHVIAVEDDRAIRHLLLPGLTGPD